MGVLWIVALSFWRVSSKIFLHVFPSPSENKKGNILYIKYLTSFEAANPLRTE